MPTSTRKGILTLLTALALIPGAARAQDEPAHEPAPESRDAGQIALTAADAVLIRPLYATRVGVGFVFFLFAAPLSAPGGRVGEAWEHLVVGPWEDLTRPLGEPF
jgi:hypothetical protein